MILVALNLFDNNFLYIFFFALYTFTLVLFKSHFKWMCIIIFVKTIYVHSLIQKCSVFLFRSVQTDSRAYERQPTRSHTRFTMETFSLYRTYSWKIVRCRSSIGRYTGWFKTRSWDGSTGNIILRVFLLLQWELGLPYAIWSNFQKTEGWLRTETQTHNLHHQSNNYYLFFL